MPFQNFILSQMQPVRGKFLEPRRHGQSLLAARLSGAQGVVPDNEGTPPFPLIDLEKSRPRGHPEEHSSPLWPWLDRPTYSAPEYLPLHLVPDNGAPPAPLLV